MANKTKQTKNQTTNSKKEEKGKTGSFEFYSNYEEKITSIQPDMYDEIKRVVDAHFKEFIKINKRRPVVLDVGAAGLTTYNTKLAKKVYVLDLFEKPKGMKLKENCEWKVGNIIDPNTGKLFQGKNKKEKYDIIIMGSLLHHLAQKNNKILTNVDICFNNCNKVLNQNGVMLIFESSVPKVIAKLEDFFYPIYSRLLLHIMKFTYVRILANEELLTALKNNGFTPQILKFAEPKHISLVFWKIPYKMQPLSVNAISARLKK